MPDKIPCELCGNLILPETALRTGGKCMQCANDVGGVRAAKLLGERTPRSELLARLEQEYTAALLRVAKQAAAELVHEDICGFWVLHTYFEIASAAVFTRETLPSNWNPCDSPYNSYREEEFSASDHLFLALQSSAEEDSGDEVERILLRALRTLRESGIFSSNVVLCLADVDQSDDQLYAYAELFNTPETLAKFRAELEFTDEWLDHWRSKIPTF